MTKQQFTLYLENKPGELARITGKLAEAKINLDGISVATTAEVALVQLVVSNAAATKRVLGEAKIPYTVQRVAMVPINNEPGTLAKVADRLAREKININYVYATACDCKTGCNCFAIISAPNLKKVEEAWKRAMEP